MKKGIGFLSLIFAAMFATGCSGNGGYPGGQNSQHVHSYTTSIVNPTCTAKGYTLHTCTAGDDSYKDNYKDALGHTYIEGERNFYCSRCNKAETDGWKFHLTKYNGEDCYYVQSSSPDVVVDGVVSIPRRYESLPVREIATYSLSSIQKVVKKMIVHDNIKRIDDYLWNGTSIWDSDLTSTSTLEEVQFDSSCRNMSVCSYAFYNCPSLAKVNLKKGMIGYIPSTGETTQNGGTADYLFRGTPYFASHAKVDSGLHYINDLLLYADFNEVSNSVDILDGTIAINSLLLSKNTVIKSLSIPNSVNQIYRSAFDGCSNLASIIYKGTIAKFKKIYLEASVFSGLKAKSISCADGNVTSYMYNGFTFDIGD